MKTTLAFTLLLSSLAVGAAPAESPDLVILNAKIHTVASKKVRRGGIAIRNGRILRVDKSYKIRDMMVRGTKRLDARGRLVIPGFNDSHTHFMAIGNLFSTIDLQDVRRREEIPGRMIDYVRFLPRGRWILGGNWDNSKWASNELPTKELIDGVTPHHPVFIYGPNSNIALVNTVGLKIAGIDKDTTTPRGGEIVVDFNGEPTGILKGTAVLLARGKVPKLITREYQQVGETASNYAASLGVTSVQDVHSDSVANVFRLLKRKGKLKTRIYDCTALADWQKLASRGILRASGDGFVREGCLKSLTFGGSGSSEDLYETIKAADNAGLQVLIHAIGSSANRTILDIFERVAKTNGPRDRRFRSEHAARLGPPEIRRFGTLQVIPSMQPHLFGGYEPYRSLLKNGAKIAFGSDASITSFNPLLGVHDAVSRGQPGERLDVAEAVRLYTLGSAYAEFQEDQKGTIEEGKYADLVILSDNIFEIPVSEIRNVTVVMTIVDGKIVYDSRDEF